MSFMTSPAIISPITEGTKEMLPGAGWPPLPFVWPKLEKKRVIVLIGFLCSCATEATQYIFRLGWCELDDIIGNTLGCLIGCLIYKLILKKQLNSLKDPD